MASLPHYADHIAPVLARIPDDRRGVLYGTSGAARGLERAVRAPLSDDPVIISGWNDFARRNTRPVVLMEHGAGQTYGDAGWSYAGGSGRDDVALFLCPSERVADLNRAAYPQAEVVVCGSPRVQALQAVRCSHVTQQGPPAVVFSWHWDCQVAPEARNAWSHMWKAVGLVQDAGFRVFGHGHPRILRDLKPLYEKWGVTVLPTMEQVVEVADVFVCDNSSAIFETAACGIPQVLMNAPWYNRRARHGLRFWSEADVGVQADVPQQVVDCIGTAFDDAEELQVRRREAVGRVFAPVSDPAGVAAEAVIRVSGNCPG